MRIELTFSSGKFVAYPDVIEDTIVPADKDNGYVLQFEVKNPKCNKNIVNVMVEKLDFIEFMIDEK